MLHASASPCTEAIHVEDKDLAQVATVLPASVPWRKLQRFFPPPYPRELALAVVGPEAGEIGHGQRQRYAILRDAQLRRERSTRGPRVGEGHVEVPPAAAAGDEPGPPASGDRVQLTPDPSP